MGWVGVLAMAEEAGGHEVPGRELRRGERRWLSASGEVDEWPKVSFRRLDDRSDVPRSGRAFAAQVGRYPAPGQEGRVDRVAVEVCDEAGAPAVAIRERMDVHEPEVDTNGQLVDLKGGVFMPVQRVVESLFGL
jgi:hypothetical protein